MEYIGIIISYIVGMFIVSYILGKNQLGGDAAVIMVLFWPLVLLAFPFMKIYELGKKQNDN
jgi:hypothetical protein